MPTEWQSHAGEVPLIQYWHSDEPPDYIANLFETFAEYNRDRPHLIFNERSGTEFIAAHLDSRQVAAFQACAVPAMQADYLRYCVTLVLGGAYSDADARCVASFDSLIPPPGEARLFQRPNGAVANGLYAVGSPGHPLIELVLEIATANIERRIPDFVYAATGPFIFSDLYRLHQAGSFEEAVEYDADRFAEATVLNREAIGDYSRVERAFEGVTVLPASDNAWIRAPDVPLLYKEGDQHWVNFPDCIYRSG